MSQDAILCEWTGEAFTPADKAWARRADKSYTVGERYMVEGQEPRSTASHNHFFASVQDAWANLPEGIAERFASSEHLRKFALVKAGFRDERSIACSSKAEAVRIAAFVKPMDDFAIVTVTEATVTIYTAKSQSLRAMGKAQFQASKDAVLDCIAKMIGSTADELARNASEAA